MSGSWEHEGGLVTEHAPQAQEKLEKPRLFTVLLHNDHYTTREFVVEVLQHYFHKSEPEATQIMLQVHQQGVGVAGVYTHEVAETKIRQVESLARDYEYPLRLSMEPHDE